VQGQPDKIVTLSDSYQVLSGAIHDAKTGPQGAKLIATYVVEKRKAARVPRAMTHKTRPGGLPLLPPSLQNQTRDMKDNEN
jgi:hypothetical protein